MVRGGFILAGGILHHSIGRRKPESCAPGNDLEIVDYLELPLEAEPLALSRNE
jgi:hypothetical protein